MTNHAVVIACGVLRCERKQHQGQLVPEAGRLSVFMYS
jgi:hypothetical protein